MLKTFAIITLWVLSASVLASDFDADRASKQWSDTELSADWFKKFISDSKCASSKKYSDSCVDAVKAVRSLVGCSSKKPIGKDFEAELTRLEELSHSRLPAQLLRATAIRAHMRHFDSYADILPTARVYADEREDEEYVGVGMSLEPRPEGVLVTEVFTSTPADRAGLKEGDLLVELANDKNEMQSGLGLDDERLLNLMIDRVGSELVVKVKRQGTTELLQFKVRRQNIIAKNVESELKEKSIGYLRIHEFDCDVCVDVRQHLDILAKAGAKSLVLDLRGNPGGEKSGALCVAELFLGKRVIVGTQYTESTIPSLAEVLNEPEFTSGSPIVEWESGKQDAQIDWPMQVWIDGDSASSSEIVAAALQDHGRATLVGENSFGKAVAQQWRSLRDNPTLTLVWSAEKFVGPAGRSHQGVGLTPDLAIVPQFGLVSMLSTGTSIAQ